MNEILVIGSSNIDMIMKMDHLPQTGETVTDAVLSQVYGGKGANQAVAAARSGGDVAFVNCVGDDANAKPMVDNYKLDGINTEYVFRETGIATGTALIMIGDQGNNYISVAPGANYRLTPGYIDTVEKLIQNSEIILLQYEILPETLAYAIQKAHGYHVKIILNLAPAREIDNSLLSLVDILVVNEIEAEYLSGYQLRTDEEVGSAAQKILEKGANTVIITLGSRGSWIATKNEAIKIPAYSVEAVDVTGAGDVFCGCLATALTEGRDLKNSVTFASAGAALSVTRIGAQPSAPFRKEINEFINSRL